MLRDGSELTWTPRGRMPDGNDNHDVLTQVIPARTHAPGQVGSTKGEFGDTPVEINLRECDNRIQGYSGQFYSSFAQRRQYWEEVLGKWMFPSGTDRPVSCLAGWKEALSKCGKP